MVSILQPGDRVGPYRLTGVLGAGGAGQVFRARWEPSDEERADAPDDHPPEVALKLLRPEVAENEGVFNRFVREIGVAQRIQHPHLVRHYDSGLADDFLYYAMELVAYGSLRDVLIRRHTLPWRDAVEAAAHLADGLGALHDAGVIHRDLKPDNVFLSEEGAIKLGDFGLAKKEDGPQLTLSGQTVGTVRYMAPEQVRGQDLDGRCDLYALGCLLTEMVAGRPPFQSTDPAVVFVQHVEEPPPALRTLATSSPVALEYLVARLLEKDRDDRPPTASSVRDALHAILTAPDGEHPDIDGLLTGSVALIPADDSNDSEDDHDARDDDDPEPFADMPNLSKRLVEGEAAARGGGCMGLLLAVVTGVGIGLAAIL